MSTLHNIPTIPIFSLQTLHGDTRKADLRRCLAEKGVFYLVDHGIPEDEYKNFETTTIDFFNNASDAEKANVNNENPAIRRGFSELESESTAKITVNGNYTDYSMCYSMGTTNNLFPSEQFETVWTNHFDRLHKLAKTIAKTLLQVATDGSEDSSDCLDNCDPVLRAQKTNHFEWLHITIYRS